MDTQQIIAEVATKHGIAIAEDDPAIITATINAIIFEALVQRAGEDISGRIAEFNKTVGALEHRLAGALGDRAAEMLNQFRENVEQQIRAAIAQEMSRRPQSDNSLALPFWLTISAPVATLLLGIIAGKLFF
jgi:hypothetical protein